MFVTLLPYRTNILPVQNADIPRGERIVFADNLSLNSYAYKKRRVVYVSRHNPLLGNCVSGSHQEGYNYIPRAYTLAAYNSTS